MPSPSVTDESPWIRLRDARVTLRDRDYAAACRQLERLVADEPDFAPAREWLGHALIKRGKRRRAATLLRDAVQSPDVEPGNAQLLCRVLCQLGRWDELADVLARIPELRDRWLCDVTSSELGEAWRVAGELVDQPTTDALGVFYHLPFSAGTSLSHNLATIYGPDHRIVSRQHGRSHISQLMSRGAKSLRSARFVRLHHPYPLVSGREERWFTFLREPVTRFVSAYRKRLQPDILPTRDFALGRPSLDRTIAHAETHGLHNPMARELAILHPSLRDTFLNSFKGHGPVLFEDDLAYLHATESLTEQALYDCASEVLADKFDVVGVVDHYDAGYMIVCLRAGIRIAPVPAFGGKSRDRRVVATDEQTRRISALHQVDAALFGEAVHAFEHTYGAVISLARDGTTNSERSAST